MKVKMEIEMWCKSTSVSKLENSLVFKSTELDTQVQSHIKGKKKVLFWWKKIPEADKSLHISTEEVDDPRKLYDKMKPPRTEMDKLLGILSESENTVEPEKNLQNYKTLVQKQDGKLCMTQQGQLKMVSPTGTVEILPTIDEPLYFDITDEQWACIENGSDTPVKLVPQVGSIELLKKFHRDQVASKFRKEFGNANYTIVNLESEIYNLEVTPVFQNNEIHSLTQYGCSTSIELIA